MNNLTRMREVLKDDPVWQKFRNTIKNLWQPEFENHIEEIKKLHTGRSIRSINPHMPTGKGIAEAAARDQMVRSRCVEIAINVTVVRNLMAVAIKNAGKYVEVKYATYMEKSLGLHTLNSRNSMKSALLGPYYKRFDDLETVLEIVDMVIEDCDKSSYTIKHLTEAITVATKREGL